jgi:ATP phosphoribosyltransferase regulatory subunit
MQFLTMKEELKYLRLRYQIYQKLEMIVASRGFIKVEPDYFEPYDRFIKMNKRIKKESMVKIFNNDGSLSILRPDVTTNIIKQVVPKWETDDELKMFYMATTFSQNGYALIDETKQFGVEYLGNSELSDYEVVDLIFSIFQVFKLNFMIEIGSQKFLNALLEALNLNESDEQTLKEIIRYKNKAELVKFIEHNEIPIQYKSILNSIFTFQGNLENIIKKLNPYKMNEKMAEAIEELKIFNYKFDVADIQKYATFDLSLISKYDYYDGITFKGYIENIPEAILSGGRYDSLTQQFGKKIAATGFSINMMAFIKEIIAQ